MRVVLIDNEDGRLSCDLCERGAIFFHVRLWKWSVSKLRSYRATFETLLIELRKQGHAAVYATPFESDTRAQKLIGLFGFKEKHRAKGLVVMERRLYA